MKIAVIDDYQDAFSKLACAAHLKGHEIKIFAIPKRTPPNSPRGCKVTKR